MQPNIVKTKVEVKGLKQVQAVLKELPDRINRRCQRKAMTKAVAPVRKAVRRLAPKQFGLLKKSIASKIRTYTKSNTVVGIVGPKTKSAGTVTTKGGKSYVASPSLYAHLVEDGAKPHAINVTFKLKDGTTHKATIQHPGAKASHFMSKAKKETLPQSAQIYGKELGTLATAEAKKLGGK